MHTTIRHAVAVVVRLASMHCYISRTNTDATAMVPTVMMFLKSMGKRLQDVEKHPNDDIVCTVHHVHSCNKLP